MIVDEVASGSELEKAGLRPGDLLRGWERPASQGNPQAAIGVLASPFDWVWLEVEQAHRGLVILTGERDGEPREFRVAAGEWNVHFNSERRGRSRVRPLLSLAQATTYEQGQKLVREGRWDVGLGRWQHLLDQLPAGEGNLVRSWLLLRIGEVWGEAGEWERAQEVFREAVSCAADDRSRIFLWEAHGKSLEYQGRFREAGESYRFALEIREATEPDSLGVARSVHQIASQEWNLGNLDRAKAGFDRALALRSRWAPGSFLEADSLHSQAFIALERSDLEAAEHFLEQAVAIQERLAPDSFWMAFKLTALGDVYALRGDLDVAAHHFTRALEIRQRLVPDGESVATALVRLGRLELDRGRHPEARTLFERALAILERVFPEQPTIAAILNNLGDAALAAGELERAERSYRQALAFLARVAPDRSWRARSWNGLAEVELRRGNLQTALACQQQALAIYRRVAAGTDGEARTLAGLGRIAWRTGDLAQASGLLHQAIAALEAQVGRLGGSEDVKAEFRALRRTVYFDATAVELELGKAEAAYDIQESARAQGFLALLAARDLSVSDEVPPELEERRRRVGRLFRRALAALNSTPSAEEQAAVEHAARELPLLREQLDSISEEIRRLAPHSSALHFPRPLPAAEVRRELDPGTVVLAYQVGESETQIFVLSQERPVRAFRAAVGAQELRRALERFRAARENPRLWSSQEMLRPLRELYGWLVSPVEPLLEPASRVLLLPDGPLHAVPWAALVRGLPSVEPTTGRDWQYFVEWKPFFKALSATVWAELKHQRRGSSSGMETAEVMFEGAPFSIAAFGDPVLPARPEMQADGGLAEVRVRAARSRGLDLTPLPSSRREVEGIAELFPGQVAVYLGSEATEERAKSLPRQTRIVHFATHGFADERFPLNSGLVLTLPERFEESGEDGLLQAWEILERVRLDADLVVLSACETGLGKDLGGEGLLSLTRAFQYAGARSVVASLWRVSDEATTELMLRFYRHLKAGAATADALRAAQLELIRGNPVGTTLSDPSTWAAFEVYGDWR